MIKNGLKTLKINTNQFSFDCNIDLNEGRVDFDQKTSIGLMNLSAIIKKILIHLVKLKLEKNDTKTVKGSFIQKINDFKCGKVAQLTILQLYINMLINNQEALQTNQQHINQQSILSNLYETKMNESFELYTAYNLSEKLLISKQSNKIFKDIKEINLKNELATFTQIVYNLSNMSNCIKMDSNTVFDHLDKPLMIKGSFRVKNLPDFWQEDYIFFKSFLNQKINNNFFFACEGSIYKELGSLNFKQMLIYIEILFERMTKSNTSESEVSQNLWFKRLM